MPADEISFCRSVYLSLTRGGPNRCLSDVAVVIWQCHGVDVQRGQSVLASGGAGLCIPVSVVCTMCECLGFVLGDVLRRTLSLTL